jgi:hypothetical protein
MTKVWLVCYGDTSIWQESDKAGRVNLSGEDFKFTLLQPELLQVSQYW